MNLFTLIRTTAKEAVLEYSKHNAVDPDLEAVELLHLHSDSGPRGLVFVPIATAAGHVSKLQGRFETEGNKLFVCFSHSKVFNVDLSQWRAEMKKRNEAMAPAPGSAESINNWEERFGGLAYLLSDEVKADFEARRKAYARKTS